VRRQGSCFASLGIRRIIIFLNKGAVKAVSPWRWLQTMPVLVSCCRTAYLVALVQTPVIGVIVLIWSRAGCLP
jgi:hypothetical protein